MKKYVFFSTISGQHEYVDTVEEARQKQRELMSEYIEKVVLGLFFCNLETTNDDNSKTWTAFDLQLEKEIPDLVDEALRKSILNYFIENTPITYPAVMKILIEEGLIKEDQMYDIEPEKTN